MKGVTLTSLEMNRSGCRGHILYTWHLSQMWCKIAFAYKITSK